MIVILLTESRTVIGFVIDLREAGQTLNERTSTVCSKGSRGCLLLGVDMIRIGPHA